MAYQPPKMGDMWVMAKRSPLGSLVRNRLSCCFCYPIYGAGDRFRTDDLVLGKHTLYQLSYTRSPRTPWQSQDRYPSERCLSIRFAKGTTNQSSSRSPSVRSRRKSARPKLRRRDQTATRLSVATSGHCAGGAGASSLMKYSMPDHTVTIIAIQRINMPAAKKSICR